MSIRNNYNYTIAACCTGYITQSVVVVFVPLLFVTFKNTYGIDLPRLSLLITVSFGVQLLVDLIAAVFSDKVGYRPSLILAHIFSAAGFAGLAVFPEIFPTPYSGIMFSVLLYAIGSGLLEVLVSPVVEACPTERKDGMMSLLHSFFCWGCVFVVLVSTLFFAAFGIENWKILACVWALIPAVNTISFMLVPINDIVADGRGMKIKELFGSGIFSLLCLLMVCSGASELGMSQWASAFAEEGLGVSKSLGDLLGPCVFAALMGASRVIYGKFSHKLKLLPAMTAGALLCAAGYITAALAGNPAVGLFGCALCGFAVGIMWPGSISMAAKALPAGGTALFAFLALAGDLGCTLGPTVIGFVSDSMGGELKKGILVGIAFPLLLIVGVILYRRAEEKHMKKISE